MPFNPFTVLTSKIFGGLALVLLLAVGVQTIRVERAHTTIAKLTGENKALRGDIDRLKRESDARKATGKRAVEADKPKAEQRARARTIIQYRESECATPPDIIEAVEKGWVR